MEQIAPFKPGFTLGERAEKLEKQEDGQWLVTTNDGTQHLAPVVAIAGGLGSFEPRKPPISNIADFEKKGVNYFVKDPEMYRSRHALWSCLRAHVRVLWWQMPEFLPWRHTALHRL